LKEAIMAKHDEPLGTVHQSREAEKQTEEVREIQRENALENLTNVPANPATGAVVETPGRKKDVVFSFQRVGDDVIVDLEQGKLPVTLDTEAQAQFQRKARSAGV
jgi:hypothetical protein